MYLCAVWVHWKTRICQLQKPSTNQGKTPEEREAEREIEWERAVI